MKPQTLRQIAGVLPRATLDPASTALIVIDFQREYFDGAVPIPDGAAAAATAVRLVDWADARGIAVIHVQHVNPEGAAVFPANTGRVAFHPLLAPGAHHGQLAKRLPSSFAGTGLEAWLRQRNLSTLVICGLMTHTCVSSTARDALSLGFSTLVVHDACATRDLPAFDGGAVSHRELHRASLAALADRFAEVIDGAAVMRLAP